MIYDIETLPVGSTVRTKDGTITQTTEPMKVAIPVETPEGALKRLIEKCETVIPYVTATINPRGGNVFGIEKMIGARDPKNCKDWIAVHGGRAGSSTNQLEDLLKTAREFKERSHGKR